MPHITKHPWHHMASVLPGPCCAPQTPPYVPLAAFVAPMPMPACADVFMRHQPIIGLALAAAAAITTEGPAGSPPPPATLWERLATYERQLLLTLPDGTQGRQMLVDMLLQAVQAASPDQVCGAGSGSDMPLASKMPTLRVQKRMHQEVVAALHAALDMQSQQLS